MFFLPLILAAGSFSTLISGAPVSSFLSNVVSHRAPHSHRASHSLKARSGYSIFGGTGEVSDGWPSTSSWLSFDTLFTANEDNIKQSCTQWDVPNPSTDEISEMKSAITSVAASTGVDSRFILAIIMQESNGCVRAPTTNYGVSNPGLMQSHDGTGTCHDPSVQNPCPSSAITQMIQDGAGGTSAGDGLKQCIASSGATDDSKYFKAARIYNSGSIASGGNLGAGIATHCYASDLANRLMGWTGTSSGCSEGSIGSVTSGSGGGSGSSGSSSSSSAAASSVPVPTYSAASSPATSSEAPSSTTSATKPTSSAGGDAGGVFQEKPSSTSSSAPSSTAPASTATTTATTTAATVSSAVTATATAAATSTQPAAAESSSSTPVSTTAEKYPYAVSSCNSWYTVVANDYCELVEQKFGITAAELQQWNAQLMDDCSNLWLGYQYCVGA
ncbi:LysM domain-containing protein [Lachnellula occidentalis]|uniref:LysM domain-containing protein n=1 Tax=Lachnellula occidentalis TaxID=215460 RepID=A0A8H8UJ08_9HELO|nr:LysM domain-containing protein [Lachnellula occidentalis]